MSGKERERFDLIPELELHKMRAHGTDVFVGGPGSGKTSELIRRCHSQGGYIVTTSHRRCHHIAGMARMMELEIPFPLSFMEFSKRAWYHPGVRKLHLDDAVEVLQAFTAPTPIVSLAFRTELPTPPTAEEGGE